MISLDHRRWTIDHTCTERKYGVVYGPSSQCKGKIRDPMTDMLVKLYNLPELPPSVPDHVPAGIKVRKPLGSEKSWVVQWVRQNFSPPWADEAEVAFARSPVSCYIAQQEQQIVGFACYDTSALGYFGPTGVDEACRGRGIGKALLLACLLEMKIKGYGYAIIGWAGPQEFYEKAVGALVIPDSAPGIWKDWLGGFD